MGLVWQIKRCFNQLRIHQSNSNTSLFIHKNDGKLLFLLVHVHDILIVTQVAWVIKDLNEQFPLKTLGSLNYFINFEVIHDKLGIYLSYHKYVSNLLKKTNMFGTKSYPTPMTTTTTTKLSLNKGDPFKNSSLYRSAIGPLQYLTMIRLDISFVVNKLSQFLCAPTTKN